MVNDAQVQRSILAEEWIRESRANGTANDLLPIVFHHLMYEGEDNGLETSSPLARRLAPGWVSDDNVQHNVLLMVTRNEIFDAGLRLDEELWLEERIGAVGPGNRDWLNSRENLGYLLRQGDRHDMSRFTLSARKPQPQKPTLGQWLRSWLPSWFSW